jgi:general L-amino acid transport system permease protein
MRDNLFSTWGNTLLTLIGLFIAYEAVAGIVSWGILSATFTGADGSACTREGAGACWPFITAKFAQFMYGRYPGPERWRVDLVYGLALAGLVPLMIPGVPGKFWNALYVFAVFPVVAYFLLVGGAFGLPHVGTELWGGLLVTLVVATVGITGSFPIGILLALGRRSKMPVVRWVSVGFIELVRGVPLITVLFMASVMLPLFLPPGMTFDKLLRALIGVALFSAAYMAEVVRGGLQAIPRGQFEAAEALGLSYPKRMVFIVLPQALKVVIPAPSAPSSAFGHHCADHRPVDLLGIAANNADQKWFSPPRPTAMCSPGLPLGVLLLPSRHCR